MDKPTKLTEGMRFRSSMGNEYKVINVRGLQCDICWIDGAVTRDISHAIVLKETYLGMAPPSPPVSEGGAGGRLAAGDSSHGSELPSAQGAVRVMEANQHGMPVRCIECGGDKGPSSDHNYWCPSCRAKTGTGQGLVSAWKAGARDFPRSGAVRVERPKPAPGQRLQGAVCVFTLIKPQANSGTDGWQVSFTENGKETLGWLMDDTVARLPIVDDGRAPAAEAPPTDVPLKAELWEVDPVQPEPGKLSSYQVGSVWLNVSTNELFKIEAHRPGADYPLVTPGFGTGVAGLFLSSPGLATLMRPKAHAGEPVAPMCKCGKPMVPVSDRHRQLSGSGMWMCTKICGSVAEWACPLQGDGRRSHCGGGCCAAHAKQPTVDEANGDVVGHPGGGPFSQCTDGGCSSVCALGRGHTIKCLCKTHGPVPTRAEEKPKPTCGWRYRLDSGSDLSCLLGTGHIGDHVDEGGVEWNDNGPVSAEEKPKPIQAAPAVGSKIPRTIGYYNGNDLERERSIVTAMRSGGFTTDRPIEPGYGVEPSKRYKPSDDPDLDICPSWEW